MDSHTKGYVYAILSVFFLASGYIINTLVFRSGTSAVTAALYMFMFSLPMAFGLMLATGRAGRIGKDLRRHWKQMLLLGLLTDVAALSWYTSLSIVGPATLGFLIRFVTVFTVVFAVIFLREKFDRKEGIAIAAMIAGALVISYQGGEFAAGALLALVTSLAFAYMQLKIKTYLKHLDPISITAYRMLFTLPVVLVFAAATGAAVPVSLGNAALIALNAFLVSIAGFVLLFKAYEHADLSKVAAIGAAEPLVILLYAFLIFGTLPLDTQLLGGAAIVAGTFMLIYFRKKPKLPVMEEAGE